MSTSQDISGSATTGETNATSPMDIQDAAATPRTKKKRNRTRGSAGHSAKKKAKKLVITGNFLNADFAEPGKNVQGYVEKRAAELAHMKEVRAPGKYPVMSAVGFITAATLNLWKESKGMDGRRAWFTPECLKGIVGSVEIWGWNLLELLFSDNEYKNRHSHWTNDRGRAVGVLVRWILINRVYYHYVVTKKKGFSDVRGGWLKSFVPENTPADKVYEEIADRVVTYCNMAENLLLKVVKDKEAGGKKNSADSESGTSDDGVTGGAGGREKEEATKKDDGAKGGRKEYKLTKKTYSKTKPVLDNDDEEDARCAIASMRSAILQHMGSTRRQWQLEMQTKLLFPLDKMNAREEAGKKPSAKLYYTFGNLTDRASMEWGDDNKPIMDVGDTVVKGKSADDTNLALLEKTKADFPRLTVYLHYECEVTPPPEMEKMVRERGGSTSSNGAGSGSGTGRRRRRVKIPTIMVDGYINTEILEKPSWLDILAQFPKANKEKLRKKIPVPAACKGVLERTNCVSLHNLALEILCDFSRTKTPEAFLKSGVDAMRCVHALAIGLSGVLRKGATLPGHPIEHLCSRNVTYGTQDAPNLVQIGHIDDDRIDNADKPIQRKYSQFVMDELVHAAMKGELEDVFVDGSSEEKEEGGRELKGGAGTYWKERFVFDTGSDGDEGDHDPA